jgi:hypothetical protein
MNVIEHTKPNLTILDKLGTLSETWIFWLNLGALGEGLNILGKHEYAWWKLNIWLNLGTFG